MHAQRIGEILPKDIRGYGTTIVAATGIPVRSTSFTSASCSPNRCTSTSARITGRRARFTIAVTSSMHSASAAASGTAGYHALLKSDASTVVATGSVGTSGADLNLSTLAIQAGQTVSCSQYQISEAES